MRDKLLLIMVALMGIVGDRNVCLAKKSLPPLKNSMVPQTFDELWAGYDPRAEPLEIETLHEWEEGQVVLRIVRFRIGVFKGQKARLAAVYGFPKDASESKLMFHPSVRWDM